jgi:hypothetical protein
MALVDDDVVNSRLRMRREEEEEDLMKFLRVDKKVVRASERTQTRKDIVMWKKGTHSVIKKSYR